MREAVVLDGGGEYTLLFKVYLPLNWGITTALAIITFIGAWNNFFWPFLVVTSEDMMTIPVGITQVNDVFGVAYARIMAVALLGGDAGRRRLPDLPAPRHRGGDDLLRRQGLTMTMTRPYTGIWPVAPDALHRRRRARPRGHEARHRLHDRPGRRRHLHPRQLLRAVPALGRRAGDADPALPRARRRAACRSSSPSRTSPPRSPRRGRARRRRWARRW